MTEMPELLRDCLFCGSDRVYALDQFNGTYAVICKACEAQGPAKLTQAKAIALWNARALRVEGPSSSPSPTPPAPTAEELSPGEEFLLHEAKKYRERALWWEAETRRVLRAVTAEGSDTIRRVTNRALALRPADEVPPIRSHQRHYYQPDAAAVWPSPDMMTEYGITFGELEERVDALVRGEGVSHEEAMRRLRAYLAFLQAPSRTQCECRHRERCADCVRTTLAS